MSYKAIVIGTSASGMEALKILLNQLKATFRIPIIIVQHLHPEQDGFYVDYFDKICPIEVKEAEERTYICEKKIYFAPPNYHLLIENDLRFAISVDEKVSFSRPSIDVLFDSAAHVYKEKLIGIILTGANRDGAKGMVQIKKNGGLSIIQDPEEAQFKAMPRGVLDLMKPDYILRLQQIAYFLNKLT